jgi:sulfonate transport system permease protein
MELPLRKRMWDMDNKSKVFYKTQTIIIAAILPVFIIVMWKVYSVNGMLNTNILASPEKVLERFRKAVEDQSLWKNILASLKRVGKGYLIGATLGFVVGALTGLFESIHKLLMALISILRPIPPIAMIPLLILALGIGEASKITIIVIGSFWPVLLNTMQGIRQTDPKLLELARSLGKNRFHILVKIILPSAVPSIFTGLRLGISQAWTCVVTAEMIAASSGVGYMIQYARELVQPDLLLLGIITIGVIGLIIDIFMIFLEKRIVYWKNAGG